MEKTYIDVPFERKNIAKSMGARWDIHEKTWFTLNDNPKFKELLNTFPALENLQPDGVPLRVSASWALPGEDRLFGGNHLFVDLIPSSCWFTNVRSAVASKHWTALRVAVISRANNSCECCSHTHSDLECHERWDFNDAGKTQTLKRLVSICPDCHESTHIGAAKVHGRYSEALQHLMDANHWTKTVAENHVRSAFSLWEERSKSTWTLDLSIITNAGIAVKEQQDGLHRKEQAAAQLTSKNGGRIRF